MSEQRNKYVVFDGYRGEKIVVFPTIVQHARLASSVEQNGFGSLSPISGGFIENGECVGESISLRLKSRPVEDTALLKELME